MQSPTASTTLAELLTMTGAPPSVPNVGIGHETVARMGDHAAGRRLAMERRIEAVLSGAGAGFAAGRVLLYLLDDATTRLLPVSQWSDADNEPVEDRRPLSSASADVAAMAGSAIVLEDAESVGEWPVPVWCEAAVCLPVASDTAVLGTIWLTFDEARSIDAAELGLMEIVAGRIALEVERLQSLPSAARSITNAPDVSQRQNSAKRESSRTPLVPSHAPVLDELELAGWQLERSGANSFYDWHALPDGRMLVASASATGLSEVDADLWLQAARIALRSHAGACRDAGELLTIASNTLWTASPGGQGMSLAVAMLDSSDATGSLALAGNSVALRWRAGGCVPIVAESSAAGWNESAAYLPSECSLLVRERLVLATLGSRAPRLDRLCRQLQSQSAEAQRRMHARGALRTIVEAGSDNGCDLRGAALVRRR